MVIEVVESVMAGWALTIRVTVMVAVDGEAPGAFTVMVAECVPAASPLVL